ncbi:selenocysteine lyase/cysteine desulfurase [Tamaricihabitans halophyticus]|uniref:Selenocysteine lyase/cysteine desulfurase n=1 Tax=Tamaricihabitans halophyticus TaxID=1262583 RepID=A0A4V2SS47_9PSEU|nr:selenocysteine lyase/cysteine desulfurase [Tamaricihabitans halophyticus]
MTTTCDSPTFDSPGTAAVRTARSQPAIPAVLGAELTVPLVTGERVPYANFDHAASTPCLAQVRDGIDELLPWYASVHRGAGFGSQVTTKVYERARRIVGEFVGARRGDDVIFTRNTTDSFNLLARALPKHTAVVQFDTEHHAALLPWRGPYVSRLATPESVADALSAVDSALASSPVGPRLLVLSAASNVTGELWPIRELSAVARKHGARVALDAAQLVAHRPVDMTEFDVDYLVFSGHKLYAPFGAGALIGRADWLRAAPPYLAGGGASKQVRAEAGTLHVSWQDGAQRHEAGSPNVVGVHAIAIACATLSRHWTAIERHERELTHRLRAGLDTVPGLRRLALFTPERAGLGVISCGIAGTDPGLLACALSAEHGIGVRVGAFCAHLATRRLLDDQTEGRAALRVSIGLGTTEEQVDRLVAGLRGLVRNGPRWSYEVLDGDWAPRPDPRPLPPFLD